MKVVAINSSPKMDKSTSALLLEPFLDGMKAAGAEVELFYTKKLAINPCGGELNCWFKTPGKCFQRDDMTMLFPKLASADIWVFATPLYVDGLAGPLKNLWDRMLPLGQPFIELRNGHCRHPMRAGVKSGKVVLIANSGFWEMDNFDPLLMHVKAVCANFGREFAGALLRPHGPALSRMMAMDIALDDIFAAAREAGYQVVENGKMPAELLKIVSRELLPQEKYVQMLNQGFHMVLDTLEKGQANSQARS